VAKAGDTNGFDKYDLEYIGEYEIHLVEDLNSDGFNDILLLTTDSKERQFFSIYYQSKYGFSKKPQEKIQISEYAILFDVANIDNTQNKEIVFLTRSGVYYYKVKNNAYSNELIELIKTNTIFMQDKYDNVEIYDFVRDFNNDGISEIVIQNFEYLSIYTKNNSDQYELQTKLYIDCVPQKRISSGLSESIVSTYHTPKTLFVDYNNDNKEDIVIVNRKGLSVYFQNNLGVFSNENFAAIDLKFGYNSKINTVSAGGKKKPTDEEGISYIGDLNNDGIMDIIAEKLMVDRGIFNPKKQIQIFFGQKKMKNGVTNYHYTSVPNQIIINEGFQVGKVIIDLNNDHIKEIVIPIVELGIWKVVKIFVTGYVNMDVLFYNLNNKNKFIKNVNLTKDRSIKVDKSGGTSASVFDIKYDFSGDGIIDLLSSKDNVLQIFYGNRNGVFNDDSNITLTIQEEVQSRNIKPALINNDKKSDIIITEYIENKTSSKVSLLILITK
jgi:hypothetical protein